MWRKRWKALKKREKLEILGLSVRAVLRWLDVKNGEMAEHMFGYRRGVWDSDVIFARNSISIISIFLKSSRNTKCIEALVHV